MCQILVDFLKDKNIVILGFGREGVSTYNYIRKYFPEKPIAIADKKEIELDDENVTLLTGDGYMEHVFDYELVIKTPGVPIVNITVPENVLITCQVDLFLQYAPCKKIGITGTKGKTTTSTLIYNLVSEAGNDAYLKPEFALSALEKYIKDYSVGEYECVRTGILDKEFKYI